MTTAAPDHPQQPPPAVEFIACSRCFSPLSSSQLWLSTCAHALCSPCLFPPPLSAPNPATACEATCPIDGTRGVVVPLEEGLRSEAGHFFRPLQSLLSEIGMAAEWQMSNLLGQLEHYKAKSLEQRRALSKVAVELKGLRGVKGQLDQLVAENASLRSQLAAPAHHPQPPAGSSAPHFAQQQHQYRENQPPGNSDAESTGSKRKARRSPDRIDPHPGNRVSLPSASSSRPTSRAHHDAQQYPLQPSRLSFTPAQTESQKDRQKQRSRQGRSESSLTVKEGDGETLKQKLAQFAYDPSRTSHRPASSASQSAPAAFPSASAPLRRPSRQHQQEQQYQHQYQQQHRQQYQQQHYQKQQHSTDFSFSSTSKPSHSSHLSPSQTQFSDSRQEQYYEEEDIAMPPPPVPSSVRRHPQQQAARIPFVPASVQQKQQQDAPQATYEYPTQPFSRMGMTPSRNGVFTPAPYASQPHHQQYAPVPTPSRGSSHRQPFRPAGGGAGGGFPSGSRAGSAQGGMMDGFGIR